MTSVEAGSQRYQVSLTEHVPPSIVITPRVSIADQSRLTEILDGHDVENRDQDNHSFVHPFQTKIGRVTVSALIGATPDQYRQLAVNLRANIDSHLNRRLP